VLVGAAGFALASPQAASAHSRAPTIALDVRLHVDSRRGVRAQVIDGNRRLRLTVDPAISLSVRGLLGEPFLRFDRGGVSVDVGSPTTAADRIVKSPRGSGWIRVTRRHSFTWHDHRLAPPRGLPAGATAPFSLPVFLDGRPATIGGVFTFVARPPWWPWLLAAVLSFAAVAALALRLPARRGALAWASAAVAAGGALVASLGFATGGSFALASLWVQVGLAVVLAVVALAGVVARKAVRTWTASLVGGAAVVLCLRDVVVFWHGVLISSLPPTVTRLAVAAAIVGGFAAAGVSFTADDGSGSLVAADDPRPAERPVLRTDGADDEPGLPRRSY
jgi:hypothetical protein